MRTRIIYDEAEWNKLAELVLPMRMKDPITGLSTLIAKAMEQMPKERRRKLSTVEQMQPVVDRMRVLYKEMRENASKSPATEKVKEETLTETEIRHRYGKLLFETMTVSEIVREFPVEDLLEAIPTPDIMAAAMKRFAGDILDAPVVREMRFMEKPKTVLLNPNKSRPPRVFVVGGIRSAEDQIRQTLQAFADVHFFNTDMPREGGDIYVLWISRSSHSQVMHAKRCAPVGGMIFHRGGIEKMIEVTQLRVEEWYNGRK
jgi:hypothetical protein